MPANLYAVAGKDGKVLRDCDGDIFAIGTAKSAADELDFSIS